MKTKLASSTEASISHMLFKVMFETPLLLCRPQDLGLLVQGAAAASRWQQALTLPLLRRIELCSVHENQMLYTGVKLHNQLSLCPLQYIFHTGSSNKAFFIELAPGAVDFLSHSSRILTIPEAISFTRRLVSMVTVSNLFQLLLITRVLVMSDLFGTTASHRQAGTKERNTEAKWPIEDEFGWRWRTNCMRSPVSTDEGERICIIVIRGQRRGE